MQESNKHTFTKKSFWKPFNTFHISNQMIVIFVHKKDDVSQTKLINNTYEIRCWNARNMLILKFDTHVVLDRKMIFYLT